MYSGYSDIVVITVRFDNETYTVNEVDEIVQPLLVLSNPSSFVEIVHVLITTTGKCTSK